MDFVVSDIDQTVTQLLASKNSKLDPLIFLQTQHIFSKQIVGGEIAIPTNWDFIKRQYTAQELIENQAKYPTGEVLIKALTSVLISPSDMERDSSRPIVTEQSTFTELKPFIAQQLNDLINDPSYKIKIQDFSTGRVSGTIEYNEVTVYIWCRAIGDWINVSKYISNINTTVGDSGGTFSISFIDVLCQWRDGEGWTAFDKQADETNLVQFDSEGQPKRPNFYLDIVLNENDLVYIKFEALVNDKYTVTDQPVAGQVWDMIGLIDTVSSSISPTSSTTSVQGRDMIKLLIEDGSIFFNSQFLGNIFVDPNTLLARRNLFTGIEQTLIYSFPSFKSVGSLLKYIVNKFSNLGIIPNSALTCYGTDLILNKYDLQTSGLKSSPNGGDAIDQLDSEFLSRDREGVWRIIDFVFDEEPGKRLVSDPSFSQDNGSMITSIRKVCQEPFIEFRGDTVKDKYIFTVRKPPFDEVGYKGLVYGDVAMEKRNNNPIEETKKRSSRKIRRGNRLIGGDPSAKKRITDAAIARRNLEILSQKYTLSNYCIDIGDDEVLSQQLAYHEEAYSWYRLIQNGFGNLDESLQFLLTPIVAFDQYAEIWGSRTLSIESNYTPGALLEDSKSKQQLKLMETQAFLDLQYVIQCNAYLPFTRTGTISITGNRTIKRGMFIFFKPTNEVFYVDQVSNSKSIGKTSGENIRTTTLQVSRGMIEPFIKGRMIDFRSGPELVSYFTIINTKIENEASINSQDALKNWRVSPSVFDFFVQKRQWV